MCEASAGQPPAAPRASGQQTEERIYAALYTVLVKSTCPDKMKLPAAAARAVPAVPLCRKGFSLRMIAVVVAAVTAWEVLGVMTGLHDPVDDLLFAAQGKKRRSSHRSGPGPDSSSSSSSARQQQLSGQNLLTGAQRDSDELTAEQMARLAVAWEASAPDTTRARTAPTDVRSQLHAPGGETTALGGPGPPPLPNWSAFNLHERWRMASCSTGCEGFL